MTAVSTHRAAIAAALIVVLAPGARADEILVSAAASLTDAMREIGRAFTRENPRTTVRFNFGASGALQQQVEQGAPVDVFASASAREMDALQRGRRLAAGTRVAFAGNRLVLIAPPASRLRGWDDLRNGRIRRIAMSNPDFVPSGRFARQTLVRRGLWTSVERRAVFGENVRQTLAYVANGDADAGVVFATDARIEPRRVRVVAAAVPGRDHGAIVYPAAVLAGAPNPRAARRFVAFLSSAGARRVLLRYGFTAPAASSRP